MREHLRIYVLHTCEPWMRTIDGVHFWPAAGRPMPPAGVQAALYDLLNSLGEGFVRGFTSYWAEWSAASGQLPNNFDRRGFYNTILKNLASNLTQALRQKHGVEFTVAPGDLHIALKPPGRPFGYGCQASLN